MTRFGYVVLTYFTVMGVAAAAIVPTSLKLVWNVSASAPIGLYRIEPAVHLDVPDLVAVMPPEPLEECASTMRSALGDRPAQGRERVQSRKWRILFRVL